MRNVTGFGKVRKLNFGLKKVSTPFVDEWFGFMIKTMQYNQEVPKP